MTYTIFRKVLHTLCVWYTLLVYGGLHPMLLTTTQNDGRRMANEAALLFVLESQYHERKVAKAAGFWWHPDSKKWWTPKTEVAARLVEYADDGAKAALADHLTAVEASRGTDADITVPAPAGLEYLPYQRAGIAYGLSHPNVLIGDEMGLGKTIQALGIINSDETMRRILIVVPASLRLNWKRECEKWLTRPMSVGIAKTKVRKGEDKWPDVDVTIINYEVLGKFAEVQSTKWDMIIMDEAHYIKNYKAKRTQLATSLKATRRILLTGTPILNRPKEIFSLVNYLDPEQWRSFFYFAKRYCNAHHNGYGWDFDGANPKTLPELQARLRSTIMVRRLKKDVLKELPPKRRQVIDVEANGASNAVKAEQAAYSRVEDRIAAAKARVELAKAGDSDEEYKAAVAALQETMTLAFTEISSARHDVALAKVPSVVEHVKNVLEDQDKVIVFAHHLDVIDKLVKELGEYGVVSLKGSDSMESRQAAVDAFQNDPKTRVFVGSLKAAGVGITLTAASVVVFAELDWVPANMSQAEDRAHRIGQTDMVLVQHLVLDGSLDSHLAKTLVEKQAIIDMGLDAEASLPAMPTVKLVTVTRTEITEVAPKFTQPQIDKVHTALRMLAASCDGAHKRDDMGFSGADTHIGKALAGLETLTAKQAALGYKIVRKYNKTQLGGLIDFTVEWPKPIVKKVKKQVQVEADVETQTDAIDPLADAKAEANEEAKKIANAQSRTHEGTIGERMHFAGKVVRVFSYQKRAYSYYDSTVGRATAVELDNGNMVIYWGELISKNGNTLVGEKGDRVEFDAKVTKHGVDKRDHGAVTTVQRPTKITIVPHEDEHTEDRLVDSYEY